MQMQTSVFKVCEVFLCEAITEGQSSVLISIKHTECFVYTYTPMHFQMIKHTGGGERGGGERGEGDTMSERGRGIQSEGERGVDAREREGGGLGGGGGGGYRERRGGRRKRVREGLSIKFTFSMFEEDIFRDRVTISDFVKPD
jgi:hypothetical protein